MQRIHAQAPVRRGRPLLADAALAHARHRHVHDRDRRVRRGPARHGQEGHRGTTRRRRPRGTSASATTRERREAGPYSKGPGLAVLSWCPLQDSNLRPSAPEADALSAELRRRVERENALYHTLGADASHRVGRLCCAECRRSGDRMTARTLLIVNPAATPRRDRAGCCPSSSSCCATCHTILVVTECAGHATELAAGANGYDLVVAVGGDGTVHEVLNGLMRIPTGGAPGARPAADGLGQRHAPHARRARRPRAGRSRPRDRRATPLRRRRVQRRLLQQQLRRRPRCQGHGQGRRVQGDEAALRAVALPHGATPRALHESSTASRFAWDSTARPAEPVDTLIVAVTIGPTYGGGFFITPDAVPDDGLFDVCMIDPLSLPEALVRLPFVIAGKHTQDEAGPHVAPHVASSSSATRPLPAQIDGEVLLEKRYDISILPGAIECVVPTESVMTLASRLSRLDGTSRRVRGRVSDRLDPVRLPHRQGRDRRGHHHARHRQRRLDERPAHDGLVGMVRGRGARRRAQGARSRRSSPRRGRRGSRCSRWPPSSHGRRHWQACTRSGGSSRPSGCRWRLSPGPSSDTTTRSGWRSSSTASRAPARGWPPAQARCSPTTGATSWPLWSWAWPSSRSRRYMMAGQVAAAVTLPIAALALRLA